MVALILFSPGSVRVSWLLHLTAPVDSDDLVKAINSRSYVFGDLVFENVTYTGMFTVLRLDAVSFYIAKRSPVSLPSEY